MKKMNKYTSPEIQNACLLAADGATYFSSSKLQHCRQPLFQHHGRQMYWLFNKEQFTICIQWVDSISMCINTSLDSIRWAQLMLRNWYPHSGMCGCTWMQNLPIVYRKCYNRASNMSGANERGSCNVIEERSRALYMHCYGHAPNLAVVDRVKQSKVCRDVLDTTFEITSLIKFPTKRNSAFDGITSGTEGDGYPNLIGIHTFCFTWWTVRGDSIESILVNYQHPYHPLKGVFAVTNLSWSWYQGQNHWSAVADVNLQPLVWPETARVNFF